MDLRRSRFESGDGESAEKFDCYGAMDLSSSCSSSAQGEEDREERAEETRKRKAEDLPTTRNKKDKLDNSSSSQKGLPLKVRNKRRNIKAVMVEKNLLAETQEAQAAEQRRLAWLADKKKQLQVQIIHHQVSICA